MRRPRIVVAVGLGVLLATGAATVPAAGMSVEDYTDCQYFLNGDLQTRPDGCEGEPSPRPGAQPSPTGSASPTGSPSSEPSASPTLVDDQDDLGTPSATPSSSDAAAPPPTPSPSESSAAPAPAGAGSATSPLAPGGAGVTPLVPMRQAPSVTLQPQTAAGAEAPLPGAPGQEPLVAGGEYAPFLPYGSQDATVLESSAGGTVDLGLWGELSEYLSSADLARHLAGGLLLMLVSAHLFRLARERVDVLAEPGLADVDPLGPRAV